MRANLEGNIHISYDEMIGFVELVRDGLAGEFSPFKQVAMHETTGVVADNMYRNRGVKNEVVGTKKILVPGV